MSHYEPDYTEEWNAIECKRFRLYPDNGGSVVAIAGDDYAVIGADTRLCSRGCSISSNHRRLFKLSENSVVGTTGCLADAISFIKMVDLQLRIYKHEHDKTMTTPALAQMMSTMLYYKRFFPYYVTNVVAGLDERGKGCVFSYDMIGHYEKSTYTAGGTAASMMLPFLDNQVGMTNMQQTVAEPIPKEKALRLLKDAFTSAAERNVETGGCVHILTVTVGGVHQEEDFGLRKD